MTNQYRIETKDALSFDDPRIVRSISEHFAPNTGQVQFGGGNLNAYIESGRWRVPSALLELRVAEKNSTCEKEIPQDPSAWIFLASEIIPVCWVLEPIITHGSAQLGNSILLTEQHAIYLSWHFRRRKMLIEVLKGHRHQFFVGDRIFMPDRDSSALAAAA